MSRCVHHPSLLAVGLVAAVAALPAAAQVENLRFTTDERFDPTSIRAYEGRHDAIYEHIADHAGEHLANIQRWLRQPCASRKLVYCS